MNPKRKFNWRIIIGKYSKNKEIPKINIGINLSHRFIGIRNQKISYPLKTISPYIINKPE